MKRAGNNLRQQDAVYAFAHSLMRDAARALLSDSERTRLQMLVKGESRQESSPAIAVYGLQPHVDSTTARRIADQEAARNNLVAAIEAYRWVVDFPSATLRERFEAQDQISRLLERQGKFGDAYASAQSALRIAEATQEPGLLGWACLRVGALLRRRAQFEEALAVLLRAEEYCNAAKDTVCQAEVVAERGLAHESMGEFNRAEACFVAAERFFRRRGQLEGVCRTLGNLARLHSARGQGAEALVMLSEADDLAQVLGNKLIGARIAGNRANLLSEAGDCQGALLNYRRALVAFETCGDARGTATTHANLGAQFEQLGEFDKAAEHYICAERFALEHGDPRLAARVLGNRGVLCAAQGDRTVALKLLRNALSQTRAMGDREHVAHLLGNIGRIYLAAREAQSALEAINEALETMQLMGLVAESGALIGLKARALLASGEGRKAQQTALDAMDWCDRNGQNGTQTQFDALAVLALYEARFGDPRDAAALEHEAEGVAMLLSARSRVEAEAGSTALKALKAELAGVLRNKSART